METIPFIQWCLENLNYWTVTLLMAIESTVLPLPSELVVPPASYMAASNGSMNVVLIVIFATIGADIGSIINYFFGLWAGRPMLYRFASSKMGRLLLLSEEKIAKVEQFYLEKGAWSVFVGRLLPGVRHLISIPAGMARMKFSTFIIYNTLGAALWNIVLAVGGYALAAVVPMDQLFSVITEYSHYFYALVILVFVLIITYVIVKYRENPKNI